MRKDVKLGFAIGGVLLAVLIVYVLVVPERQPSDVQLVDADGKAFIATPAPVAPIDSASPAPDALPTTPEADAPTAPSGGVASATPESPSLLTTPAPRSDVDWDALLGGGEVLMTSTPQAATATPAPTTESPVVEPVIESSPVVAPTTRPAAVGAAARTHVVRSGETLSSISKAAYGSANFYPHILRANPGLDANRLKVGTTLNLPAIDDVVPAGIAEPTKPVDAASEYRVASGDSLYSISMRLYGSAERMNEIYELNKQTIGADPSKLKLNMVLKLPAPPTKTAAR